uniref:LIM zinc-binding domain-containing protein n=1 Tax=Phaeomonas parva TaxID=124430 RepID=A0A7S1XNE4_9STRA|mmetsp:Transcript_19953/g.60421  ORF Transcript_19953/g.60421 Transcript_19953/m.60421 type:complete len:317 (+) Transcript_19953:171-1121(+)
MSRRRSLKLLQSQAEHSGVADNPTAALTGGDRCWKCNKRLYAADSKVSIEGKLICSADFRCEDCRCKLSLQSYTVAGGTTLLCKTHYFERFHTTNSYGGDDRFSKATSVANQSSSGGATAAASAASPVALLNRASSGGSNGAAVSPIRASSSSNGATTTPSATTPSPASSSSNDASSAEEATAAALAGMSLKERLAAYKSNNHAGSPRNSADNALPPAPQRSSGGARFKAVEVPKCWKCGRSVYAADIKVVVDGKSMHKACFKCADCKRSLGLSDFTFAGTDLLCKTHYFQRFNETNAYGGDDKFSHNSSTANRSH